MIDLILMKIGTGITIALTAISSIFSPSPTIQEFRTLEQKVIQNEEQKLGNFLTVAGKVYYLYGGGIGSSDTSITLTSFKTPVSNYNLVMTNFGTTGYLTVEPANTTKQEIVSFTGITQNADGSATLTGVTRGLSPVSPYTASTTIQKSHSGGSVAVISNPPQLYDSFPAKSNNETITGSWSFPLTPTIDANPASKKYVDDTAFSGAGVIDASATARGVVELATGLETASSTSSGGSGILAIPASLATSTYNSATAGLKAVVTQNNGKIDPYFIATSTLGITNNAVLTGTTTMATSTSLFTNGIKLIEIGKNVQVFSSVGTTTFSTPSGVSKIYVQLVAGGGGGGGAVSEGNDCDSGGGGGGGGYAEKNIDITGTSTIQVFVGSGGVGSTAGAEDATAGTWSTFGTNGYYMYGKGGSAGLEVSSGEGGSASGGDLNISGGKGGAGVQISLAGVGCSSGEGGNSMLGSGGKASQAGVGGGNSSGGTGYGGGGGGRSTTPTNAGASSNGAQGIVIIRW